MQLPVTSVSADQAKHEITVECGGTFIITESDFLALDIAQTATADPEKLSFCADKLACIKKSENYLSYGDLSERKLREKLKDKFEPRVIDTVVNMLRDKGYIDDASLAERYASELARTRLWGVKRISQYLYAKGFRREDIAGACDSLDAESMRAYLRELIEKTAPKADLSTPKAVSAYGAKLYRLGWDWDEIKPAIAEYSKEQSWL
ncbi:MAG: RecX family transcriptional regulator [Clostridia bacterium]|nr:RecX family transcriptional regulator [Clostridia bacterium]